jgi:hypothetical protein
MKLTNALQSGAIQSKVVQFFGERDCPSWNLNEGVRFELLGEWLKGVNKPSDRKEG